MLCKPIDAIVFEDGKVVGVRSGDETAKCKQVYCDPSYAQDKIHQVGQVIRATCLLHHPVPGTKDALSTQIIIPQKQVRLKISLSFHSDELFLLFIANFQGLAKVLSFLILYHLIHETPF